MPGELSESDCFVLLANRRRRLIVQILEESSTPLATRGLAERIAEREREDRSPEDRRAVRLALHHNHLPRLEDADVVTYDREDGTVYPGLNFDALAGVLKAASDRDGPWTDE